VRYRLKAPAAKREAAERAHAAHTFYCPVARSIMGAIAITTDLEFEEVDE
jgi:hypothetical protein